MENNEPQSSSPEENQNNKKSIDVLLTRLAQMAVILSLIFTCWFLPDKLYLFIFISFLIIGTVLYFRNRTSIILGILLIACIWGWYIYNQPEPPPQAQITEKIPEELPAEDAPKPESVPPVPEETTDEPPIVIGADLIKVQVQTNLNALVISKHRDDLVEKIQANFNSNTIVEIHYPNMSIPVQQDLERYLTDLNTQKLKENIKVLNEALSKNPTINHKLIVFHNEN